MSWRERYSEYLKNGSTRQWLQAIVVKAAVELTIGVALGYLFSVMVLYVATPVRTLLADQGIVAEGVYTAAAIGTSLYTLTLCTYANPGLVSSNDGTKK